MQNLKTLIVGAGIAGLTCAGLLLNQGIQPVVVEREEEESFNKSGYMLGLLPSGGRVLNELNVRKDYFENSIQVEKYEIRHSDGTTLKEYPLDFINDYYGSYRGISRRDLIDILLSTAKQAQKDSRILGKMMFISTSIFSKLRDEILPFYSLQRMLADLTKVMEGE